MKIIHYSDLGGLRAYPVEALHFPYTIQDRIAKVVLVALLTMVSLLLPHCQAKNHLFSMSQSAWLPQPNSIDWVSYTKIYFLTVLKMCKIKIPAWFVSAESSILDMQIDTISLCPLMGSKLSGISFDMDTIALGRSPPTGLHLNLIISKGSTSKYHHIMGVSALIYEWRGIIQTIAHSLHPF